MRIKNNRQKTFKKMRELSPSEIKIRKVENFIFEWKEEIATLFAATILGIAIFLMYSAVLIDEMRDSLFRTKKLENC